MYVRRRPVRRTAALRRSLGLDEAGGAVLTFGAVALGVAAYWWIVEGEKKHRRRR